MLISYNETKKYNIAFIGDSMTEGPGLDFEDTIVGIIDNHFKTKKIAGEYYYEKLFRMHFCDALTYREIEEITKIEAIELLDPILL